MSRLSSTIVPEEARLLLHTGIVHIMDHLIVSHICPAIGQIEAMRFAHSDKWEGYRVLQRSEALTVLRRAQVDFKDIADRYRPRGT